MLDNIIVVCYGVLLKWWFPIRLNPCCGSMIEKLITTDTLSYASKEIVVFWNDIKIESPLFFWYDVVEFQLTVGFYSIYKSFLDVNWLL